MKAFEEGPTPLTEKSVWGAPVNGICLPSVPVKVCRRIERRMRAAETLLTELFNMVKGECPAILDEDCGGTGRVELDILAHIEAAKKGDEQ